MRPAVRAPVEQPVDLVVVVAGIVVEQHEPAGAGLPGHEHGVVDGAVAPVRLRAPTRRGQYCASWIRRSTPVAQLEHGVGDASSCVRAAPGGR